MKFINCVVIIKVVGMFFLDLLLYLDYTLLRVGTQ